MVQAAEKAPGPSAPTTPIPNSTKPVTIDFRDTSVAQIFQTMGDLAGWNVIVDPAVTGRFSVTLKAEPLNRALDLISVTTGFAYTLIGNTLVVATPEKIAIFAKREMNILPINSLAPETAKTLLEASAPGLAVTIDAVQRMALLSGTPEQVAAATNALTKYDVPAAKEFEFVDQTVAEILRTLAKSAGLSVMLEGNLSNKLTIYLKDMPARDAMTLVAARAGVQQESTPAGVLVFRPVVVPQAVQPDANVQTNVTVTPTTDSQVLRIKYLPVGVAADMLSTLYPSLEVKTGKDETFLVVKGPASDLATAFAFITRQDFPTLRLAGVVVQENSLRAVLEINGRSQVVQAGQTIDDLVVESLSPESITVRRGDRREVVTAGGGLKCDTAQRHLGLCLPVYGERQA
jgi:type II secretory pathway component GspD/PulD (secretin)